MTAISWKNPGTKRKTLSGQNLKKKIAKGQELSPYQKFLGDLQKKAKPGTQKYRNEIYIFKTQRAEKTGFKVPRILNSWARQRVGGNEA